MTFDNTFVDFYITQNTKENQKTRMHPDYCCKLIINFTFKLNKRQKDMVDLVPST